MQIDKPNKEMNAALGNPKIRAQLADLGMVLPGSSANFENLIAAETEKWRKVIHSANIKAKQSGCAEDIPQRFVPSQ